MPSDAIARESCRSYSKPFLYPSPMTTCPAALKLRLSIKLIVAGQHSGYYPHYTDPDQTAERANHKVSGPEKQRHDQAIAIPKAGIGEGRDHGTLTHAPAGDRDRHG